jgi:threonine/homoserine/homoserine lactone efflux protein
VDVSAVLVGPVAAMSAADVVFTVECAVIGALLVFLAWWCMPAQRSKRRREDARRRIAFRRELHGRGEHNRDDDGTHSQPHGVVGED